MKNWQLLEIKHMSFRFELQVLWPLSYDYQTTTSSHNLLYILHRWYWMLRHQCGTWQTIVYSVAIQSRAIKKTNAYIVCTAALTALSAGLCASENSCCITLPSLEQVRSTCSFRQRKSKAKRCVVRVTTTENYNCGSLSLTLTYKWPKCHIQAYA